MKADSDWEKTSYTIQYRSDMSEREQGMQISRHWRLNSQRYRLEGVRYENGEVSLQNRPAPPSYGAETVSTHDLKNHDEKIEEKAQLKAAS